MNDRCRVKSQLNGLTVGDLMQQNRIAKLPRITVQHSRNVLPNGYRISPQGISKDGGTIVRPLTAQSGGQSIGGAADKTL